MSNKLFKTPFSREYWKLAFGEVRDIKKIIIGAILVALISVLSMLYVPVGTNLRVMFTFIPTALMCLVLGPAMGTLAAIAADIVGALAFPTGPFFLGYTISAAVGGLIYGLLFYRTKISVLRIIIAKTLVNVLVNIGLGCLWSNILYGKGYILLLGKSIAKNLPLLPLEILVIYLLFSALIPVMSQQKLIPRQPGKIIPFI